MRLALVFLIGCGDGTGTPVDARSGDGAPDAATAGTYAAYHIIGGLDRIRIAKLTTDACFAIQLVSPGAPSGALSLPNGWGYEFGRAMQPPAACNPAYLGPIQNMFDASDATGTVAWSGAVPQTVSEVQVTLAFANAPSWCPPSSALQATNVAVQ